MLNESDDESARPTPLCTGGCMLKNENKKGRWQHSSEIDYSCLNTVQKMATLWNKHKKLRISVNKDEGNCHFMFKNVISNVQREKVDVRNFVHSDGKYFSGIVLVPLSPQKEGSLQITYSESPLLSHGETCLSWCEWSLPGGQRSNPQAMRGHWMTWRVWNLVFHGVFIRSEVTNFYLRVKMYL